MRNRRIVNREAQPIDYHLNILGVRVWRLSAHRQVRGKVDIHRGVVNRGL